MKLVLLFFAFTFIGSCAYDIDPNQFLAQYHDPVIYMSHRWDDQHINLETQPSFEMEFTGRSDVYQVDIIDENDDSVTNDVCRVTQQRQQYFGNIKGVTTKLPDDEIIWSKIYVQSDMTYHLIYLPTKTPGRVIWYMLNAEDFATIKDQGVIQFNQSNGQPFVQSKKVESVHLVQAVFSDIQTLMLFFEDQVLAADVSNIRKVKQLKVESSEFETPKFLLYNCIQGKAPYLFVANGQKGYEVYMGNIDQNTNTLILDLQNRFGAGTFRANEVNLVDIIFDYTFTYLVDLYDRAVFFFDKKAGKTHERLYYFDGSHANIYMPPELSFFYAVEKWNNVTYLREVFVHKDYETLNNWQIGTENFTSYALDSKFIYLAKGDTIWVMQQRVFTGFVDNYTVISNYEKFPFNIVHLKMVRDILSTTDKLLLFTSEGIKTAELKTRYPKLACKADWKPAGNQANDRNFTVHLYSPKCGESDSADPHGLIQTCINPLNIIIGKGAISVVSGGEGDITSSMDEIWVYLLILLGIVGASLLCLFVRKKWSEDGPGQIVQQDEEDSLEAGPSSNSPKSETKVE